MKEARSQAAKAKELGFAMQSAAAVKAYEEALVLFGRGAPALDSFREYAQCLVDLGAALIEGGKDQAGEDAFRRALVMETGVEMSPNQYAPSIIKHWKKAKADLARQIRSSITVTGRPEGAALAIDGRTAGALPVTITDVPPGEHWITAQHAGKKRFSTLVSVKNKLEKIEVFMVEDPAAAPSRPEPTAPASQPAAVAPAQPPQQPIAIKAAPRKVNPFVALLPFGVGQFVAKRPVPGALLLATEVAMIATNLACFFVARADRQPDGTYNNSGRVLALAVVGNVALGVFIVESIIGAIDGLLHREIPD